MMDVLSNKKARRLSAVLHILVWSILLLLPFLSSSNSPRDSTDYLRMWVPTATSAIIFYLNYFYLIPRLLFNKRTTLFVVANLILFVVLIAAMEYLRSTFMTRDHDGHGPSTIEMVVRIFITFMMTTGVSVAILTTSQWFKSEALREELEKEHIKTELANLKNQLNPHFFFNTLNTIYGLIPQQPDMAQQAVHRLSKLMRYHLYDSNEKFVPLGEEVAFMNNYIDLMRYRLTPDVSLTIRFPKDTHGISVAPLLFIPLIENGFKHGINLSKESSISMEMSIVEKKTIVFHIRNTSYPARDSAEPRSRIGIENLKRRLSLLYPGKHTLQINDDGQYFDCTVTLTV